MRSYITPIAFIAPPGRIERSMNSDCCPAYVPGNVGRCCRKGMRNGCPAGSRICFSNALHAHRENLKPTSHARMVFADGLEVTHEVFTLGGIEQDFEIPPHNTRNYRVENDEVAGFPRDGEPCRYPAHARSLVSRFRFVSIRWRGYDSRNALESPPYDFKFWQHSYELAFTLLASDIDRLRFHSYVRQLRRQPDQIRNPERVRDVGRSTWQEMALVFVSVARPLAPRMSPNTNGSWCKPLESLPTKLARGKWASKPSVFARGVFQRFAFQR